jgi:hypothetical protein
VGRRQFGAMREQARVTDAFFEPLPDDELDARNDLTPKILFFCRKVISMTEKEKDVLIRQYAAGEITWTSPREKPGPSGSDPGIVETARS